MTNKARTIQLLYVQNTYGMLVGAERGKFSFEKFRRPREVSPLPAVFDLCSWGSGTGVPLIISLFIF